MSGLPSIPTPPGIDLPPPPTITLDDIIGPAPEGSQSRTPAAPAAEANKGLNELSQALGIPVTEGQDAAATSAALRPVIDMIAKGGMQQELQQQQNFQQPQANNYGQIAPPPPAPVQQAPVQQAPAPVADFNMDDVDLGDASPGVVKAFKAMAAHSKQAVAAANKNADAALRASYEVHSQWQEQSNATQQAQEAEVGNRAVAYLDSLAAPKYGVGQSRNMVQTMAAEQVMRHAGHIIRGMKAYGQTMPIESVMNAAIFAVDGQMPAVAPAGVPTPTSALAPQTPTGTTPAANVRGVGSTGVAQNMMGDAEYMDGARAILSR